MIRPALVLLVVLAAAVGCVREIDLGGPDPDASPLPDAVLDGAPDAGTVPDAADFTPDAEPTPDAA